MEERIIKELSEVFQSSNVNFLFGAGTSIPFLPRLGDIEKRLNEAKDPAEKEKYYKEYFEKVMLPNKELMDGELKSKTDFDQTKEAYNSFFKSLTDLLIKRKSTLLSKQASIFTTNIDVLLEYSLEELQINFNDGFSGKFNPVFSLANFKKSIHQRSLHFDHVSEIPVINIIKIHGSLTWAKDPAKANIIFSSKLDHLDKSLGSLTGADFKQAYDKILVVNPEESKFLESVLNLYYSELLRLYSSELEKENSTLFVIGFSMDDAHIREITIRAAQSNPTLRVFICCSQGSKESMEKKMLVEQHANIQIFTPEGASDKYTVKYFTESVLHKIG